MTSPRPKKTLRAGTHPYSSLGAESSSPDLNDRSRPAFPIRPPVHVARVGFAAEKAGPTGLRRRGHEGGQGLRRACLGCAAFLDA